MSESSGFRGRIERFLYTAGPGFSRPRTGVRTAATAGSTSLPRVPDQPLDPAGPLLLGLLDDAALLAGGRPAADDAVAAHRALREGPSSPAIGPLLVRVSGLGALLDALDAAPSSTPLDIALVADTGLVELAEARAVLLDDDRLEALGLVVALPVDGPLGESAAVTLDSLDFALPAVVEVPLGPGWADAVAVVVEDGAERVGARASSDLAPLLVEAASRGAALVVTGAAPSAVGDGSTPGVLNLLAAATEAADVNHVAALLTERDPGPLLAIVASADPRAVRGRLASVGCADAAAVLDDLRALGLLEEDAGP